VTVDPSARKPSRVRLSARVVEDRLIALGELLVAVLTFANVVEQAVVSQPS